MGLVLGLTGSFGSGKSTASRFFAELGCPVIDADKLAREALAPGSAGLGEAIEVFGPGVLDEDGALDRAALAALVFGDRAALDRLNAIVHPHVRAMEERLLKRHGGAALTVLDVPLLFETGADAMCGRTAVVVADERRRFGRLRRRGFGESEIVRRLGRQMPQSRKIERADILIDNNGTPAQTRGRVAEIYRDLTGPMDGDE